MPKVLHKRGTLLLRREYRVTFGSTDFLGKRVRILSPPREVRFGPRGEIFYSDFTLSCEGREHFISQEIRLNLLRPRRSACTCKLFPFPHRHESRCDPPLLSRDDRATLGGAEDEGE